jgi:phage-related protein
MSPDIVALDARIKACMAKHGITQDDLDRLRRSRKISESIARAAAAFSDFGAAMGTTANAINSMLQAAQNHMRILVKHNHMRRMISDAVDGFETKDAARSALFEALSTICDADQSEYFGNMLGRIAHEKARHEAALYEATKGEHTHG